MVQRGHDIPAGLAKTLGSFVGKINPNAGAAWPRQ
jgi:hypothetical protein